MSHTQWLTKVLWSLKLIQLLVALFMEKHTKLDTEVNSLIKIDQLDVTCFIISLFNV